MKGVVKILGKLQRNVDDAKAQREGRRIWTVGDFEPACKALYMAERGTTLMRLLNHGPHRDHCDGWEVLAWPCIPAAEILDDVLGGAS